MKSRSGKSKIKMKSGSQQFQRLMKNIKPSFVESCHDEIQELFPEAHTLSFKNKKGKIIPDKRLFHKNYSVQIKTEKFDSDNSDEKELINTIDNETDPLAKIITNHVIENEKIPKNARIDIGIYTAMRYAQTNIPHPSKDKIFLKSSLKIS